MPEHPVIGLVMATMLEAKPLVLGLGLEEQENRPFRLFGKERILLINSLVYHFHPYYPKWPVLRPLADRIERARSAKNKYYRPLFKDDEFLFAYQGMLLALIPGNEEP